MSSFAKAIRSSQSELAIILAMAMGYAFLNEGSLVFGAAPFGETAGNASGLKFELDIQPILTARGCNTGPCHGKARGQNGFALSLLGFDADMDYHALVKDARGRRIFPAAPEQSLLLLKATGAVPHGGGIRIEPNGNDYQILIDWIRVGARRTNPSDRVLSRIQISPEPHSLQAGQEESLRVIAIYSDESKRDVTETCAYLSNEPAIVGVNQVGRLKAGQLPGEATIMARYMGRIATWSTAIPRPESIVAETYAHLPRNNFIDPLVYAKHASLNLLPSEPCSDSQYLRRAHLDVIGRLPNPEEARAFLIDDSKEKRAKLVDGLLQREEYADFWANKWADLLRPNPYRVGIKATMSLDDWIRDAFRRNLPYDQFVAGLLTAQGSTFRNGAVTIFRDRREPAEIVTMASQLFLGVRLECAKCHQHPFEVYSQKDFYSLAAYFARVGYKGTGLSPPISGGEEILFVKKDGSVRHPLTNEVLPPKPLLGAVTEIPTDEDPRVALMQWMTASDNPHFAQVAINRIWADMFGIGMVDPVDDMRATNPPSNPELLAALSRHFREVGFDQKALIRTIMASHIYSIASLPNPTNVADNRNFSRHYRQRLRAEVLTDAISDVTLIPDDFKGMPKGTRAMQIWTHRVGSDFLDAFGRPDANQDPPCERLPDSTVVQALHMMNSPGVHARITKDDGRCHQLAKSDLAIDRVIEELYLATYSRFPTDAESKPLIEEYNRPGTKRRAFIEDILWSLLNSPEFTFKD